MRTTDKPEKGNAMLSYWAYVLIGNNNTGKTTFQRFLQSQLCDIHYQKLPRNLLSNVSQPRMPLGVETLWTMNRSYQEMSGDYGNVANFFKKGFKDADICILSSHANRGNINHVQEMIHQLRLRAYNVAAVFMSNGYNQHAEQMSLLDWDERLWLENPATRSENQIERRIGRLASEFTQFLIARAAIQ